MFDYVSLQTSIIVFIVVVISLTVHEFAHGYISYLLGDNTAKRMGRLTLNPIRHLDPIGALCMFFFKFGWAKAVPINPNNYKNYRLGTVIVSLAGPLTNLFMAFVATIVLVFYAIYGTYNEFVIIFFNNFIVLNIGLAIFNLIPISPLDGSKILLAFLPERAYRFVLTYEKYGFVILFALSYLGFFSKIIDNGLMVVLNVFLEFAFKIAV